MTKLTDYYLGSRGLRFTAVIALALTTALFVFRYPAGPWPPYRVDFDVYRTGGQMLLDGQSLYAGKLDILSPIDLPFTYPPIAAALFTVFTPLPLWAGSMLLTVISIAALVLVFRLILGRFVQRSATDLWWLASGLCVGAIWLQPVADTLKYGQVNILLMTLVVVDMTLGHRRRWGGVLVGLAAAIKLTPLVFLLYFVLRRDWRASITTVASTIGFTTLGFLIAPSDSRQYWTETIFDPGRIGGPIYSQNQSIRGELLRLQVDSSAVWLAVSALVVALIAWTAWRLMAVGAHTPALVVVAFSALYASPLSWDQHWVWVAPLLIFMAYWAIRTSTRVWWALIISGVAIFLSVPHKMLPNRHQVELEWSAWQHIAGSAYLLWGLAAIIAIGVLAPRIPADLPSNMSLLDTRSRDEPASWRGSPTATPSETPRHHSRKRLRRQLRPAP